MSSMSCSCNNRRCYGTIRDCSFIWKKNENESIVVHFPFCDGHHSDLLLLYQGLPPVLTGSSAHYSLHSMLKTMYHYEMDLDSEEEKQEHGLPFCTCCSQFALLICTTCNGPICTSCYSYGGNYCCWMRRY